MIAIVVVWGQWGAGDGGPEQKLPTDMSSPKC